MLRIHRIQLAAATVVYLVWWGLVQVLLPGAFNPLTGRLVVVGMFAVVLGASYVFPWVAGNLDGLFQACAWVLTSHYVYLVRMNGGEPAWWGGFLITVAAVAACLHTQRALAAYSVFALVLAIAEAVVDGQLEHSVFPPGVATVLFLSNLALRSRLRAEQERVIAAQLREQRDRAEEVSRFKTMFLGLVSHELLTPIQSIQLGIEALARYPNAPAGQRLEREERITRSLKRLRELIRSLLDYVQLEAGRLEVRQQELDLVAVVTETVDDMQPHAKEKQLALSFIADPAVPYARTDPRLVRLVLVNLLTNAFKYTDSGRVDVDLTHDGSGHRLSVRDTGPGIAAEDQARIFEPFTQLGSLEHKHAQGFGLGLALVKQMLGKLGARLEVSSVVGTGSTFTMVLPCAEEAVLEVEKQRGAPDALEVR